MLAQYSYMLLIRNLQMIPLLLFYFKYKIFLFPVDFSDENGLHLVLLGVEESGPAWCSGVRQAVIQYILYTPLPYADGHTVQTVLLYHRQTSCLE